MPLEKRLHVEAIPPIQDLATHDSPEVAVHQLADYFFCDTRTIMRMLTKHEIPSVKRGGVRYVSTDRVRALFGGASVSRET